jgi:hypothetical protein
MNRIHLLLVELGKYFYVIILLMALTSSCLQKEKECVVIKDNFYKGYGFFYFTNRHQDSYTELCFIPVCTEKKDLLHFRNLNPQTGLDVYCDRFDDSFLKNIAMYSKVISGESGLEYHITPVYIEFEEAWDYQERLQRSDVNQPYLQKSIPLNDRDNLMVSYFLSGALLSQIIQINKIEFFSFAEE